MEAISRIQSEKVNPSGADAKDCSPERGLSTDEIERRRSIMAMALARRMKLGKQTNELYHQVYVYDQTAILTLFFSQS